MNVVGELGLGRTFRIRLIVGCELLDGGLRQVIGCGLLDGGLRQAVDCEFLGSGWRHIMKHCIG